MFALLLFFLCLIPLPLGSNRPLAWSVVQIAAMLLFVGSLLTTGGRATNSTSQPWSERLLITLLALSVVYQFLLAMPLPLATVVMLNPTAGAIYQQVGELLGDMTYSLSLYRGGTLVEALKAASYLAVFATVLLLASGRRHLLIIGGSLIAIGVAQTLFGALDIASGGALFQKVYYTTGAPRALVGTYANYNHMAGFLEMAAGMALGLLLARRSNATLPESPSNAMRQLAAYALSRKVWLPIATLCLLTGLLMTTSRGGNGSFVVATMIGIAVLVIGRRTANRGGMQALVVVVVIALAATAMGGDKLINRLAKGGVESDHRLIFMQHARSISADYRIWGAGPGSWQYVYPMYETKDNALNLINPYVHNDYLELLAEQGIIGFVLFGSAILLGIYRIGTAILVARDPQRRGLLTGCFIGLTSLLLHSVVDFNLQIPANAVWFSVLLAVGLVAARQERCPTAAANPARGARYRPR